jgi:hypothetical protein
MKKLNITEKIKSFEDACEFLGLDPNELPAVDNLPEKDRKSITAYYKLIIITRAINQGWEPIWSDTKEYKWWNYFYTSSASGFVCSNADYASTDSGIGSRLCFKARELAEYARKQFEQLYLEYLYITIPQVDPEN